MGLYHNYREKGKKLLIEVYENIAEFGYY